MTRRDGARSFSPILLSSISPRTIIYQQADIVPSYVHRLTLLEVELLGNSQVDVQENAKSVYLSSPGKCYPSENPPYLIQICVPNSTKYIDSNTRLTFWSVPLFPFIAFQILQSGVIVSGNDNIGQAPAGAVPAVEKQIYYSCRLAWSYRNLSL